MFPLALPLAVERVHLGDLHAEDRLDGVVDLGLGGVGVHLEGVGTRLGEAVGLLAHDRSDDDVAGVLHDEASWVTAAAPPLVTGLSIGRVSGVKTTQSDTSTSWARSEEHTSELQSLMRNSDAVFCL